MNKSNQILRSGFALFSAITSFIFVYYAVGVITGETSNWLKTFAYVAGGYGLFNIYILSWAWRTAAGWTTAANLAIAACFFGVVVMDALRGNLQGGQQLLGILGLAAVLVVNWFTVRILCRTK